MRQAVRALSGTVTNVLMATGPQALSDVLQVHTHAHAYTHTHMHEHKQMHTYGLPLPPTPPPQSPMHAWYTYACMYMVQVHTIMHVGWVHSM